MKVLKELAYLISLYKDLLKLIDESKIEEHKYLEAYLGILENKWQTELAFANDMDFQNETDVYYINFREKLTNKILKATLAFGLALRNSKLSEQPFE